jgi:hypothetical protein
MKIVMKTTWRDKREENRGEERATLLDIDYSSYIAAGYTSSLIFLDVFF